MRSLKPKRLVTYLNVLRTYGMGLFFGCLCHVTTTSAQGIRPWVENEWYWEYQGKPIMLLGGSDDDNLFQWPKEQLIAQLDKIQASGGNVIRNTMSDRKDKGFEQYPFKQLNDGRYDLNQWNAVYWERFQTMLQETARRKVMVQIEIWDRFDYTDTRGANRWQIHPYNPKNNVNYDYESSRFERVYPDHPGANKQLFFYTTPEQRKITLILGFQQRFVKKMLDISLQYDHVLYCMDNETKAQEAWGKYWAEFVKQQAKLKGKRVYVTEMWDDWNLRAERHRQTFDFPELYDYVDVSQNNHNKGRKHWDNFLYVKNYLSKEPRPINTTKTYGATGNKFGHNDQDAIERFWRHILAGAASARFHRPDSGLGINQKAVHCIRAARLVESIVAFWQLDPAMEVIQTSGDNHAYAATSGSDYLVIYFTGPMPVRLVDAKWANKSKLSWVHVDTGRSGPNHQKLGNTVSPPRPGNWVAVIH